ncbi:hypothetical protein CBER1_08916 [Cercospora berteroae]|uniref:Protein kinase domain-containing protein n=1 Tax=Cercospora berteroae TaxID=357750 RepID=A0A2S6BW88_9PEZI|nr:hypothetical protein CBER1_08916 [Cercospora berteroae]
MFVAVDCYGQLPTFLSMDCIVLADGSRIDAADLIGSGLDGFVIRKGCHVLKIPKLFGRLQPNGNIEEDSDNFMHLEHLEIEKQVYERLQDVPGIAKRLECTSNGILLEYYPGGPLSEYISCHSPPSVSWRWYWALQATEIISRCHERGVLVFDIALRNFVLADDFSLRIIDFANSTLVPQSEDIAQANVDGCTATLDLLHLSNVIYSIMTWEIFSVECAMETEWPTTDKVPNLEGLDYGQAVHKCWDRRYTSIQDLLMEMRLCAKNSSAIPFEPHPGSFAYPEVSVQSSSPAPPPARC